MPSGRALPRGYTKQVQTSAAQIFSVVPDADAVMMDVCAFNHGGDPEAEPDSRYYDVIRKDPEAEIDFDIEGKECSGWDAESLFGSSAPVHFREGSFATVACLLVLVAQLGGPF